jgi:cytochrome c oxidase subunit I
VHAAPAGAQPAVVHMPSPSFWPLVVSVGLLITACGVLFVDLIGSVALPIFLVLGLIVMIGGIFGWSYEPA